MWVSLFRIIALFQISIDLASIACCIRSWNAVARSTIVVPEAGRIQVMQWHKGSNRGRSVEVSVSPYKLSLLYIVHFAGFVIVAVAEFSILIFHLFVLHMPFPSGQDSAPPNHSY